MNNRPPSKTTSDLRRVRELLAKTLEHAPSERLSFLDDECPKDTPIRREVETLLSTHDHLNVSLSVQISDFTSDGQLGDDSSGSYPAQSSVSSDKDDHHEFPGTGGRYILERLLGSGDWGEVYYRNAKLMNRR